MGRVEPMAAAGHDDGETIPVVGRHEPDEVLRIDEAAGIHESGSTGDQVEATDVVTVQYTGFAWTTGEEFDSTWKHGLPVSFSLQDVQAWGEGLVDQPVGSQVMLVVPPTYALGVTESEELAGQTVVFVVDILATGHPEPVTG